MKKVQTLNEEIQKMRKLMSFNINENSHDSLSEENFNKSTEGDLGSNSVQKPCEQTYSGPSEIVKKMTNALNGMLEAKLEELEKQVKVGVVASNGIVEFQIGDQTLSLEQDPKYNQYNFASKGGAIEFNSDLPLSLFKEKLLNSDKCFRMVYDKYDSVKNQIDNQKIPMKLVSAGYGGEGNYGVKMFIEDKSRNLRRSFKKGTQRFVDWQKAYLSDFKSPFFIKLNDFQYGKIEADWGVELVEIKLFGADIPKSWGEPDPNKPDSEPTKCFCNDVETGEQITYECGSPLPERCKDGEIVFDFAVEAIKNFPIDEAVLTQEAKDIIDENIVKIWNPIPQYRKEEYLEFLEDKTIVVNAYASIDALSNFPDGGRYAGCSKYGLGKGPRVKYNQCLSEARAKAVVEYLKTIANGAFKDVNFVAVGKGETNQWSGLVWNQPETKIKDGVPQNVKSPYSNEETRPDRRFEIKFPAYRKEE
jgi:outer membrane protein OmpA-like peptidoglycan-associated protein